MIASASAPLAAASEDGLAGVDALFVDGDVGDPVALRDVEDVVDDVGRERLCSLPAVLEDVPTTFSF